MSRVYAGDSRLLTELASERRIFVPIAAIPDIGQRAFIFGEDQNFYILAASTARHRPRRRCSTCRMPDRGAVRSALHDHQQRFAKNMLLATRFLSLARPRKRSWRCGSTELSKDRILELY